MNILSTLKWINNEVLIIPSILIFSFCAIYFTFKNKFSQFIQWKKFFKIIKNEFKKENNKNDLLDETVNSLKALFISMATTIGIGNIVSPSIAIILGGPGALFWLILYIILGSSIKYNEVLLAIKTRKNINGKIVGGPMQYLGLISDYLSKWYSLIISILILSWSALQGNTLSAILNNEGIEEYKTGLVLSLFILIILNGGLKRISKFANIMVPFMCAGYMIFSFIILFKNKADILDSLILIIKSAFCLKSATGGICSIGFLNMFRVGIYRGIFITESGLGTSSISHSSSNNESAEDQATIAMFSAYIDAFLSLLSGLIFITNKFSIEYSVRSTIIYEIFKLNSPLLGKIIFTICVILFSLTTIIGNSFNGRQAFSSLTNSKYIKIYTLLTIISIYIGSISKLDVIWEAVDIILTLVSIPNLFGLLYLTKRNKIKK
jgi:AGCS family alanine or glycine:cation symporter